MVKCFANLPGPDNLVVQVAAFAAFVMSIAACSKTVVQHALQGLPHVKREKVPTDCLLPSPAVPLTNEVNWSVDDAYASHQSQSHWRRKGVSQGLSGQSLRLDHVNGDEVDALVDSLLELQSVELDRRRPKECSHYCCSSITENSDFHIASERLETTTPVSRHSWAPSGCGWPWLGHWARWHRRQCTRPFRSLGRWRHGERVHGRGEGRCCWTSFWLTGACDRDHFGGDRAEVALLRLWNYVIIETLHLSADPASNVNQWCQDVTVRPSVKHLRLRYA